MSKSRDRPRSPDVSRPIFDGLGLGLEGCGLGLDVSGLGLKGHCYLLASLQEMQAFSIKKHKFVACTLLAAHLVYLLILTFVFAVHSAISL